MSSTIDRIARSFIIRYYKMMSESPQELHKFYFEESDFIHPYFGATGGETDTNCRGLNAIRDRVAELNLSGTRIDARVIDAQASANHCVLVCVTGYVTPSNGYQRVSGTSKELAFVQTFVLAPQNETKKSYYVRNSVFRVVNPVGNNTAGAGAEVKTSVASTSTVESTVESNEEFPTPVNPVPAAAAPVPSPAPAPEPVPAPAPAKTFTSTAKASTYTPTASTFTPTVNSSTEPLAPQARPVSSLAEPSPAVFDADTTALASLSAKNDSNESKEPVVAQMETASAPAPEEKKPFSYKSALTTRGPASVVTSNGTTERISASGGPGWNVASTKKAAPSAAPSKEKENTAKEKRPARETMPTLYANNLESTLTKDDLHRLFSNFGTVNRVDMNPKGFAFIEFESVGALQAALTAYRGDDERFTFGDMRICLEEKTGQKQGSKSRDGPKGQGQRDRTGKAGGAKGGVMKKDRE